MKASAIRDIVNIKGDLFTGKYIKRAMRSQNLYCWFCNDWAQYPHASILIGSDTEDWTGFHVTFSLTKEKGGWETGVETASYSVFVVIDQQTDEVTTARTTDASRWKLSGTNPGFKGFADANRTGLMFAKAFYSAAFLGT